MTKNPCWVKIRTAVLVTASAVLFTACGGTAVIDRGDGATAGRSGVSGSNGASGSKGDLGGAANGCDGVNCLAIGCGPGSISVLPPGECCPVCEPDGSSGFGGMTCPGPCAGQICENGMKSQPVPGACCAFTCVPDPAACANGQAAFRTLRDQLLAAPDALSCSKDSDCQLEASHIQCGDQCPSQPLSVAAAPKIEAQLSQFETDHCSTCMSVIAPCVPPRPPACIDGTCVTGAEPGNPTNGASLFRSPSLGCSTCHGDNAEGDLGPNITGNLTAGIGGWTLSDFRDAVRSGTNRKGAALCAQMQPFPASSLSEQGIADLYAFTQSQDSSIAQVGVYCTGNGCFGASCTGSL